MLALLTAAVLFVQAQNPADSLRDTTKRLTAAQSDSARRAQRRAARIIPLTPELLNTAFEDKHARTLLEAARAARLRLDSSLVSYDATTYTRVSVGLRVAKLGRDRLAFRTENASRVQWHRKRGIWIETKGQRMVVPIVKIADEDAEADAADMAEMAAIPYYPGREPLFFMGNSIANADIDTEGFIHPLANGAEAYYRYSSGDSITIKLGDGKLIRVQELRVRARAPDWKLSVGSLWIDVATGQFVRGVFRLSQQMDIWKVAKEEDDNDLEEVPKFVKPLLSPMRANISSVTIEYGLHEGRFWLPRVQTAEAEMQMTLMRVPAKFVNTFTYASVNGTTEDSLPEIYVTRRRRSGDPDSVRADSIRRSQDPRLRVEDSIYYAIRDSLYSDTTKERTINVGIGVSVSSDSASTEDKARSLTARALARLRARGLQQCDTSAFEIVTQYRYQGTVPVAMRVACDHAALASSPDLPGSIYDEGEELFDEGAKQELLRAIGMGQQSGFAPQWPMFKYGLGDGLLRYNRVEGLSPGVIVEQDLGAGLTAQALARFGFADHQFKGELALWRSDGTKTIGVAGYRRLTHANLFGDPLTLGASMSALLFARDEGLFYRTVGAELRGSGEHADFFGWRAYIEQQRSASVHTHASLPRIFGGPRFQGNIVATEGTWFGTEARLHASHGVDPRGLRLLGDVRLDGAGGKTAFFRSSADATITRALTANFEGALTAGGGIGVGDPPVQKLFFLGGSQTVRGQSPATAAGTLYWLGRAELGRAFEFYKPTIFYDVGWAGDRFSWKHPGTPLSGAGVGLSLLDGMIRTDLARGLQPQQQWRMDFYLEARF